MKIQQILFIFPIKKLIETIASQIKSQRGFVLTRANQQQLHETPLKGAPEEVCQSVGLCARVCVCVCGGGGQVQSKLNREPIEARLSVVLQNGAMTGDMVSCLACTATNMTGVEC